MKLMMLNKDREEMEYPLLSIIIPTLNEEDFIKQNIESILNSNYPRNKIEILVVDGQSTDNTQKIVRTLPDFNKNIKLIINHEKITPVAFNLGIKNSTGEILFFIGGHATIDDNFLKETVTALKDHPEAWCAGGAITTIHNSSIGKVISAALSSPFGVGNARFRTGNYEGYVDTIAFGGYWKWVFDKIGTFDVKLIRNQDADLNFRLIKAGGKIYLKKSIISYYYSRASVRNLWGQYFQYGFWRVATTVKHKKIASIRQLIPLLFILGLLGLGISSLFIVNFLLYLICYLIIYIIFIFFGSIIIAIKKKINSFFLLPFILCSIHFTYGFGSILGIINHLIFKNTKKKLKSLYKITRQK